MVQALTSPSPRVDVIILGKDYSKMAGVQELHTLTVFLSGSLEEDEAREILVEFLLCDFLAVPSIVK